MADVIDIFSKNKVKKDNESYFKRRTKCLENFDKDGICLCESCIIKNEIANKIVTIASVEAHKYMRNNNFPMYMGDIMDILIEAQLIAEDEIIQSENKDDE